MWDKEDVAAAGYLAGWKVVRRLPQPVARTIFRWVADFASDNGRGMDGLRRNLTRVVGAENVTRELVRDSMRSYMRYWMEAFRLPAIHSDPQLHERLMGGLEGLEHFDASAQSGRGVILALPHSGNWDMAGVFLVGHYGQFTTVAERLRPEVLFDAFVDYREELGFEVLPLTGGPATPFARLKEALEEGGVVCLLAERDITRSGITVDFMGEEANMAAGPAQLAIETGAALHVVHSWFEGDGWGLSVSPEVEVTDIQETTQRMADGFAANIRRHPADWHMLQPQWNEDVERRRQARKERSR
ncbi:MULTISPECIES: phosphatidylinositol mannoside acyltransferase [Corynebacterium]|jgi:lipid A biosynthesis lauroyl acyltransferase|uniref:phosphatidylinositol mannoside acyltransferase n=1 Tax=Corynebacterium TaxID=1716 RepID=UPI0025434C91|nr:phosphatidylinositol mannoside acyltransferase [Corynebacterium accolens]MDK4266893.1 phosphatidylinositol mannoside acyltransferase [Corynebacterium accolens]MDK4276597.1 phosphatidylinositol mannoside acyltransferase [Corynebacterium accolens]MDK4279662.1 phosphatidylinositol mannoside acyltransferase [Corynebacterium accolens]MDK4294277.1 phosphatidylinositol mannoside acyltransferase [Corynebacterium accolens]MDK4308375.1 phosphatidylinositol mannoside acyltransferase [Corynebacterium a